MAKALEAEVGRLSALDDAAGLTSEEAAALRQMKAYLTQRESHAKQRAQQQEALSRMALG